MAALIEPAARLYAALAGLIALFHLAVLCGAPFGRVTMGGRWPGRLPWPARGLSVASAALILWTATVWIGAAGIGPETPTRLSEGLAFGVAGLSVAANAATRSLPERRLWLPVTLVLLVCASVVLFRA